MKRYWPALALLSLGAITFAVYFQSLSYGLNLLDDPQVISGNPHILAGVTKENLAWAWTTTFNGIWHPITWHSFQLESETFGAENHQVRHLINLLIHVANVFLVYVLINQFAKGKFFIAFSCALLFAIHPQHVQVVTWITERKELLATFFVLLSLLVFIKWQNKGNKTAYMFSLCFYTLALMSKPSAIPMVVIFGFLIFRENAYKFDIKKQFVLTPFVIVAVVAAYFVISIKTTNTLFTINFAEIKRDGVEVMDTWRWLGLIPLNLAHYLTSSFVPWPLPMFNHTPDYIDRIVLIYSLLVISLFILICIKFRHSALIFIGLIWFIAFWLPVSGLISLGEIYVADRYMYLPHIGLFIIVVSLISRYWSANLIKLIFITYVIALSVLCFKQNQFWRDGQSLFGREVEINADSYLAPIYLGSYWHHKGEIEKALSYFDKSIENGPDRYYGYFYKGMLYQELNDHTLAINNYFQALSTKDYRYSEYLDVLFVQLAWMLFEAQRYEEADQIVKRSREEGFDLPYINNIENFIDSQLQLQKLLESSHN